MSGIECQVGRILCMAVSTGLRTRQNNQRLLALTRDLYALSDGVYGDCGIHGDLCEIGETCDQN